MWRRSVDISEAIRVFFLGTWSQYSISVCEDLEEKDIRAIATVPFLLILHNVRFSEERLDVLSLVLVTLFGRCNVPNLDVHQHAITILYIWRDRGYGTPSLLAFTKEIVSSQENTDSMMAYEPLSPVEMGFPTSSSESSKIASANLHFSFWDLYELVQARKVLKVTSSKARSKFWQVHFDN